MKKIVALLLVVVMLFASFLTMPALAEESVDYFAVNFVPELGKFVVSSTTALKGTNRVLVLVQDGVNTIYMDAVNATADNAVYFEVDLGGIVDKKEYSFIISSYGDTMASQTLTCMVDVPEYSDWFSVEYDSMAHAFRVNSIKENYLGANRVVLTAYLPEFNGYHEIFYMDAINVARSFSFTVPVPVMAPIGEYVFRVASVGDMTKVANVRCEYSNDFIGYTENISNSTEIKMGGKYILESGAEADGVAIYVALYKKAEAGEAPLLVRATYSDEIIREDVNYIKSEITLTEEEQTSDYYVRVYAWKQATLYPLAPSIKINQ